MSTDTTVDERLFDKRLAQFRTHKGLYFDLVDPAPSSIHIEDIAHALSNLCRYGGHSNEFYSVAQHSVHVMDCLKKTLVAKGERAPATLLLKALLHDAAEAYIGDVIAPLKHLLPDLQRLEVVVQDVINEKFSLNEVNELGDALIEKADRAVFTGEAVRILGWTPAILDKLVNPGMYVDRYMFVEHPAWTSQEARAVFLQTFTKLNNDRVRGL